MSKTLHDPHAEPLAEPEQRRVGWRVYVTVLAILSVLLCAFLITRYTVYREVQEKFFGQTLVPAKDAYDFHLVDQDGNPFQLSQLRGKVALFSFGFTHCPNVCPTTLADLAKVYRAVPDKNRPQLQILFITIDPDRDSADKMKEYVPYFDSTFKGLTGSADQIAQTAKAYGAFYEKQPTTAEDPNVYFMNHSAYIYLIGPDGKWRILYGFDQLNETEKIAGDIERVIRGL
jgi:protein SCO1/2